jgi:hypothetical protein
MRYATVLNRGRGFVSFGDDGCFEGRVDLKVSKSVLGLEMLDFFGDYRLVYEAGIIYSLAEAPVASATASAAISATSSAKRRTSAV